MYPFITATALLASAAITVNAQYNIDPLTVPIATRQYWCQSQITQCPLICLQEAGNTAGTEANDCSAVGLAGFTNGQSF